MPPPREFNLQALQKAFRELEQRIDRKLGPSNATNTDAKGKRFTNAGDAVLPNDLVTLQQLNDALGIQTLTATTDNPGTSTTSGGGGVEGGTDDGLGAQGCSQAGSDGHVTGSLTAVLAGQIVCGTANEFPSLTAITADQATRDANAVQLLERMIWHLAQAGFTAGRQINPSGLTSGDKLTVQIEGEYRAYDVFTDADNFATVMQVHMNQVFPADYSADAGISD
jgi:hypothetical protein